MKPVLALSLLSCAAPILSAPVPYSAQPASQECTLYGCRSSSRRLISLWGSNAAPKAKQSELSKATTPTYTNIRITRTKLGSPAGLENAIDHHVPESWIPGVDREFPGTTIVHGDEAAVLAKLQEEDAKRFGYAAVKGMHGGCNTDTKYTVTVGYSYVKKDYKDVLIVGLVIMFLAAVLLVEVFDTVVDA